MRQVNRTHFFNVLKGLFQPLHPTLTDKQKLGYEVILSAWDKDVELEDDRMLAYMLATVYHETARTMQPIKEKGGNDYFIKRYFVNAKIRKQLGNLSEADAVNFCGNGYVQITGRANYEKFEAMLHLPLSKQPELARRPDVACDILFEGMQRGIFTGKKLSDYINGTKCDFVNARRIINGIDKAEDIAEYAHKYMEAITYIKIS